MNSNIQWYQRLVFLGLVSALVSVLIVFFVYSHDWGKFIERDTDVFTFVFEPELTQDELKVVKIQQQGGKQEVFDHQIKIQAEVNGSQRALKKLRKEAKDNNNQITINMGTFKNAGEVEGYVLNPPQSADLPVKGLTVLHHELFGQKFDIDIRRQRTCDIEVLPILSPPDEGFVQQQVKVTPNKVTVYTLKDCDKLKPIPTKEISLKGLVKSTTFSDRQLDFNPEVGTLESNEKKQPIRVTVEVTLRPKYVWIVLPPVPIEARGGHMRSSEPNVGFVAIQMRVPYGEEDTYRKRGEKLQAYVDVPKNYDGEDVSLPVLLNNVSGLNEDDSIRFEPQTIRYAH